MPDHPEKKPNEWGHVDSEWAGCPDSHRSTSGFVIMLNGAAISWRSKRQPTIALSSAETEFISASSMAREVIFHRLCKKHNLGFPRTALTPVFADNETCIAWSEGSIGSSDRAKHVDLRMHFVHEGQIWQSGVSPVTPPAPVPVALKLAHRPGMEPDMSK